MSEFSRETLLNIIETDHVQCGEASALARMALAAMDSESVAPVVPEEMTPEMMLAVQLNSELGAYAVSNLSGAYDLFAEFWKVACRAAMPQAGNSTVIPDDCSAKFGNFQHYWNSKGYVIVPNEPTEAMCDISHIGVDVYCGITDDNEYYSIGGAEAAKVWKAMLAAAPKLQETPQNIPEIIPDGWTGNDKANAALMMLDRIETVDPVDDDRIDGIKRIVRDLAAAPQEAK